MTQTDFKDYKLKDAMTSTTLTAEFHLSKIWGCRFSVDKWHMLSAITLVITTFTHVLFSQHPTMVPKWIVCRLQQCSSSTISIFFGVHQMLFCWKLQVSKNGCGSVFPNHLEEVPIANPGPTDTWSLCPISFVYGKPFIHHSSHQLKRVSKKQWTTVF